MGKKEVSSCEIEFTISIDKFFNKCVLYMTWEQIINHIIWEWS